jgi:hypothetical protein
LRFTRRLVSAPRSESEHKGTGTDEEQIAARVRRESSEDGHQIRSGLAPGEAGTLVAGGFAPATLTATGRFSLYGDPEYTLTVNGLNVNLGPGTYWLSVAPEASDPTNVVSPTSGASAVGTWNEGDSYVFVPCCCGNLGCSVDVIDPTPGWNYSMGIDGEVNGGGCDGIIAGRVLASYPSAGTPLLGVHVDVFDSQGAMVGTAVTDESGQYSIGDLSSSTTYTVTVVTPLGYQTGNDDLQRVVSCGETVVADFAMDCVTLVANPRTQGFWKHQVGVATGGPGQAQIDGSTLCSYLDLIESHFNENGINQVIVYQPPASGLCPDKLDVAKDLLNLRGSAGMTERAKQQLMALLLNVTSGRIGLLQPVSADGAAVSQAITYCDRLIDGPSSGHETAKTISDLINNNSMVPEGLIPLDTEVISYRHQVPIGPSALAFTLDQNVPNPFRPLTVVRFTLSREAPYELSIFSAAGSRIRRFEGVAAAGVREIVWDGSDEKGARVAPGVYDYRLDAEGRSDTRRMVLLK